MGIEDLLARKEAVLVVGRVLGTGLLKNCVSALGGAQVVVVALAVLRRDERDLLRARTVDFDVALELAVLRWLVECGVVEHS